MVHWVEEDEAKAEGLVNLIGSLAREGRQARTELSSLEKDLTAERRAVRSKEKQLGKARQEIDAARAQAKQAKEQLRQATEQRDVILAQAEHLESRVRELEELVEIGRRERRDLRSELDDAQERLRRTRTELRTLRTKLPVEVVRPPAPVEVEPPPTLRDLAARFRQGGTRAVLEAKHIWLIVDGWNVSLSNITAEHLKDKRRVLEQALQQYQSVSKNAVTVVYDGRKVSWFWVPRAQRRTITRVFTSEGETADDYIVSELEAGTVGITPVVVTSDRELVQRCSALGAFHLSSEQLAQALTL